MASLSETCTQLVGHYRFAEAEALLAQVIGREPENAEAMRLMGALLARLGRNEEAEAVLRRCVAAAPDDTAAHQEFGLVLGTLNRVEEAEKHFARSVELEPRNCAAYCDWSQFHTFTPDDPMLAQMRKLSKRKDLSQRRLRDIQYALSYAYNALGEWDRAIRAVHRGAKHSGAKWDLKVTRRKLDEIEETFTPDLLTRRSDRGDDSAAPVFIVGVPRSGTTLAEQILSRHSRILGAGEMHTIPMIMERCRRLFQQFEQLRGCAYGWALLAPDKVVNDAAAVHMAEFHRLSGDLTYPRFVDKMPSNIFNLGFISMMFPNARIIHMRRHPLDTCVSCYFQNFVKGHDYTRRLEWMGGYYRLYARIARHFRQAAPNPWLEVRYEDLVSDPEPQIRRMIEFTGMDWEDACLTPEEADRSVRTASTQQVRKGINTGAIERWRRYEDHLDPLVKALGGMEWIENWAAEGAGPAKTYRNQAA